MLPTDFTGNAVSHHNGKRADQRPPLLPFKCACYRQLAGRYFGTTVPALQSQSTAPVVAPATSIGDNWIVFVVAVRPTAVAE